MKVPKTHSVGNEGQSSVSTAFSRIGWGPIPNAYEDFGIDLYVSVRSEDGKDKGLLVCAQVKSGTSQFRRPVIQDGETVGWYFGESNRTHLSYWLEHPLPQLLVLYSPESQENYWAHLKPEAIEYLPKGWKVPVFKTHRIDDANRPALFDVATSKVERIRIEGSAWTSLEVPPDRRWRHALLAPRLMAPHKNKGASKEIDAQEGLALIVERRVRDFEAFAAKFLDVPTLEDAFASKVWSWRFVSAVSEVLGSNASASLSGVVATAPSPDSKVAAGIVLIAALCRSDRHSSAMGAIEELMRLDGISDSDLAWLLVHRSRIHVEIGSLSDAHIDALEALRRLAGEPSDVTVSAIAGTATSILWTTMKWETRNLGEMIESTDNAVSWWRDQPTVSSLTELLGETFSAWGESTSLNFSMDDPVILGLEASVAMSEFVAEQSEIGVNRRTLARCLLVSRPSEMSWGNALNAFRQIGDRESIERAIPRALGEGPVEPVRQVLDLIEPDSWTRSSIEGNLALWEHAGDVMTPDAADSALAFCFQALLDADHYLYSLRPMYVLPHYLYKSMAGLLGACTIPGQSQLLQTLESKAVDPNSSAVDALGLSALCRRIRWSSIDPEVTRVWCTTAIHRGKEWEPSISILAGLCDTFDEAAEELRRFALAGNWWALAELRDPSVLGIDAVIPMMDALTAGTRSIVTSAEAGSHGGGGMQQPTMLAWLNINHPEIAQWEALYEFIVHPKVLASEKASLCKQIAVNATMLTDSVSEHLATLIGTPILAVDDIFFGGPSALPGALFLMRAALGVLTGESRQIKILELLDSSSAELRANSIEALGLAPTLDSFEIGVIVGLLTDPSLSVRLSATMAVARQVSTGCTNAAAVAGLMRSLGSDSVEIPYKALAGLARRGSPLTSALKVGVEHLVDTSPSAKVRRLAQDILEYEARI